MESLWNHNCEYFALRGLIKLKVVDVYDGDTITAIACMDDHGTTYAKFKFRLYGIDAPEMKGATLEDARISRNRLAQLLLKSSEPITHNGKLTHLFNDGVTSHYAWAQCSTDHEKYGRVLARIYTDADCNTCVNDILVNEGLAVAYGKEHKDI
jgi:endonuclease YncB( thermonuclease family)